SIISVLLIQYENTPLKKSFKSILEKIMEGQSIISKGKPYINAPVSIVADAMPEINNKIFTKILSATRTNKTLNIVYDSATSGKPTEERTVNPYHIVCHKGSWYLLAYDFSHINDEPFRWFAFPRIKECHIQKNVFTPFPDFDLSKYFNPKVGILWTSDPINVKLKVFPVIAKFIAEREWFQNQITTWDKDGSVTLDFITNHPVELDRFIMNYSPDVKVLEPESLKNHIKELLTKSLYLYS
ncbi:MAG: WYL domain-containing protein, partial [Treponema sp.]|nr:WYL domain-containing protein [Treponema sp.]